MTTEQIYTYLKSSGYWNITYERLAQLTPYELRQVYKFAVKADAYEAKAIAILAKAKSKEDKK